jgi:hypothetical protein
MLQHQHSVSRAVVGVLGACALFLGIGLLLAGPSGAEPSAPASAPASTAPVTTDDTSSPSGTDVPTPTIIDDSGMTSSTKPAPTAIDDSGMQTSDEPSLGIGDATSTSKPPYSIGDATSTSRPASSRVVVDASSTSRPASRHVDRPRSSAIVDKACPGIGLVASDYACPPTVGPTAHTTGHDEIARTGRPVTSLVVTGLVLTAAGALLFVAFRRSRRDGVR